MASKRCGCASDHCSCVITGGVGVEVSGAGTQTNPYVLDADLAVPNLTVQDENTLVRDGVTLLDFTGPGVSATPGDAGEIVVTIPGAGAVVPMAAGTAIIPAPAALNTPVSVAVTFPVGRFSVAPMVTATINSSSSPQIRSPLSAASVTATGATFWVAQLSGALAATTIHWHAIQAG